MVSVPEFQSTYKTKFKKEKNVEKRSNRRCLKMWFVFNIIGITFCIVIRVFCQITTFKVLKYDEYFYESNPIVRKLLNHRNGKIFAIIVGYLGLSILLICNFMVQITIPKYIWIPTIGVLILLPVHIYDFLNDIYYFFGDYRKIKRK